MEIKQHPGLKKKKDYQRKKNISISTQKNIYTMSLPKVLATQPKNKKQHKSKLKF